MKDYISEIHDIFLNMYDDYYIELIKTGILRLDKILAGGFKSGSIVDIRGESGSGKSLLSLSIIKENSDKKIIYVNANKKYNVDFLYKAQINPDKITIIDTNISEDIFSILFEVISNNMSDIIIIDDIASLNSKINDKEKVASIISKYIRDFSWYVSKYKNLAILMNQNRNVMGKKFYLAQRILNKEASYIIECQRSSFLRYDNQYVGQGMRININKPIVENSFIEIKTFYNKGIDENLELIEFAIENNILERRGNWVFFKDKNLGNGIYNAVISVGKSRSLYNEINLKLEDSNNG